MNRTPSQTVKIGIEHMPILTCNGVNRRQAFRLGNHVIGYGDTDDQAIENLILKEHEIPAR